MVDPVEDPKKLATDYFVMQLGEHGLALPGAAEHICITQSAVGMSYTVIFSEHIERLLAQAIRVKSPAAPRARAVDAEGPSFRIIQCAKGPPIFLKQADLTLDTPLTLVVELASRSLFTISERGEVSPADLGCTFRDLQRANKCLVIGRLEAPPPRVKKGEPPCAMPRPPTVFASQLQLATFSPLIPQPPDGFVPISEKPDYDY